jgi:hypothetical protein
MHHPVNLFISALNLLLQVENLGFLSLEQIQQLEFLLFAEFDLLLVEFCDKLAEIKRVEGVQLVG